MTTKKTISYYSALKNKRENYKKGNNAKMTSRSRENKLAISRRQGEPREISPNITEYHGPVRIPRELGNLTTKTLLLHRADDAISSAAGIIAGAVSINPNGVPGWADLVEVFDEFRVLAVELEYFPRNRYSKTTTVCVPGYAYVDHSDSSTPGSATLLQEAESCRVMSLEDPWTDRFDFGGNKAPPLTWRMSGIEEAEFLNTSSFTQVPGSIKYYFQNLSASTTYGLFFAHYLVQFRGHI